MIDPNIAELRQEFEEMKSRVDLLEQRRAKDEAEKPKHLDILSSEHAMREALLQFTQEVAAREGIPVELFVSRFEAAKEWHRDRFLQMVEAIDPDAAAQIDDRKVTEIPTEDFPPYIFPE
jgi:nucleotide-binding universal stress UspA family protein